MDKELARLKPANAPTAERVPDLPRLPRTEILEQTFHQRQALVKQVHQMARRGEISPTYRLQPTDRGWAVKVVRLREPGRRWKRPAMIAGAALALAGGAVWVLALAVQALAAALAALLPVLLGVLVVLGVLAFLGWLVSGSGGGGTAVQNNYFH